MLAALGAAVLVVTGAGAADASPALGRVVSTARRGIVELNPTTGAVDPVVNAELTGNVSEAAVVNGRLVVSGTFGKKIAALNLATGADTGYLHVPIAGSVAANAGAVEVYRFAVNPAGTRLVGIGNFTTVGGRPRVRALMLTLGATSATVNAWRYRPLEVACAAPKIQPPSRRAVSRRSRACSSGSVEVSTTSSASSGCSYGSLMPVKCGIRPARALA